MTRQDKKDFEIFQKEFKYWQERFGLLDWEVYFKHEPVDAGFACIHYKNNSRVATATINSDVDAYNKELVDPKGSAKHEAIHLLLSDLAHMGLDRHATSEDLEREEEKLVVKLMKIIK